PDNLFQITTVAFGLRSIADTDRGIAEMVRVTRPAGKVAILEFSQPRGRLFGRLYRFYFRHVLPRLGQAISRSRDNAYHYLPASVLEFPDGEVLAERLRRHGLKDVRWHSDRKSTRLNSSHVKISYAVFCLKKKKKQKTKHDYTKKYYRNHRPSVSF